MVQSLVLVGASALSRAAHILPAERERVLGRSSKCDLVIDHPSVSRRHAALEARAGAIRVTDLGSSNGTFVDGVRVARAQVGSGQEVRFGGAAFLVGLH